ncbi:Guanylate-binding protein, C-terminal [Artemisia annua]|uniref:Guanylate-binding protein, C-terminal n=1 Tax=Artemisia annua TaxID=35608 RepID=A0A2U1Q812_ARTAN|nr:Guanylate-binding protein, C-terminal [Artemisia annua]
MNMGAADDEADAMPDDYKKNVFREVYLQCSNAIQSMEKELRKICHAPSSKLDNVLKDVKVKILLDELTLSFGYTRELTPWIKRCKLQVHLPVTVNEPTACLASNGASCKFFFRLRLQAPVLWMLLLPVVLCHIKVFKLRCIVTVDCYTPTLVLSPTPAPTYKPSSRSAKTVSASLCRSKNSCRCYTYSVVCAVLYNMKTKTKPVPKKDVTIRSLQHTSISEPHALQAGNGIAVKNGPDGSKATEFGNIDSLGDLGVLTSSSNVVSPVRSVDVSDGTVPSRGKQKVNDFNYETPSPHVSHAFPVEATTPYGSAVLPFESNYTQLLPPFGCSLDIPIPISRSLPIHYPFECSSRNGDSYTSTTGSFASEPAVIHQPSAAYVSTMPTNATGSSRAMARAGVMMNLDFSQGIILEAPSFTGSYGPTSGLPTPAEALWCNYSEILRAYMTAAQTTIRGTGLNC